MGILANLFGRKKNDIDGIIISEITEENLKSELENLMPFEIFLDNSINIIYDIVKNKIDVSLDEVSEIINKNNVLINLQIMYTDRVIKNISEAEVVESDAIEYHKSFGSEKPGDPILHPKEKSESYSDDISEKSIDELSETGTIEDIE